VLDVDAPANKALGSFVSASDEVVPVMRNGRVVGLINGADLLRWLMLHREQVAHG
jgi:CBS domain-containing protein